MSFLSSRSESTIAQFSCDRKTRRVKGAPGSGWKPGSWGCLLFLLNIHGKQRLFPAKVIRPAAPRPIPRMIHQAALYRIRVHVIQLFPLLSPAIHIEIVKPRLPERPQRFTRCRKRQSPVTTESNKVQIAFAVIAFKARRHRQPQQKKQPPQDPGSHPEPGAPSVSLYFPETCRSDILSATQMSTNFKFSIRATRLGVLVLYPLCFTAFLLAHDFFLNTFNNNE